MSLQSCLRRRSLDHPCRPGARRARGPTDGPRRRARRASRPPAYPGPAAPSNKAAARPPARRPAPGAQRSRRLHARRRACAPFSCLRARLAVPSAAQPPRPVFPSLARNRPARLETQGVRLPLSPARSGRPDRQRARAPRAAPPARRRARAAARAGTAPLTTTRARPWQAPGFDTIVGARSGPRARGLFVPYARAARAPARGRAASTRLNPVAQRARAGAAAGRAAAPRTAGQRGPWPPPPARPPCLAHRTAPHRPAAL